MYAIIKKKINKEKFCNEFKKYNIDMRPMFYQISTMPAFKNKKMSNYNKISRIFLITLFVYQMVIILMKN